VKKIYCGYYDPSNGYRFGRAHLEGLPQHLDILIPLDG
jgi:hypothetical protein